MRATNEIVPGLIGEGRFELLPRIKIVDPYLLIVLGVNLNDEYMASITRPELIAAAKEAYNLSDNLPSYYDLKWRRMTD